MIDHAPADLWIVPLGTKCFEDPSLLDERERFKPLAIGVAEASPVVIGLRSGACLPAEPRRSSSSAPTYQGPACTPGIWSKAASTHCRSAMRWRSTSPISSGSVSQRHGDTGRNSRSKGAGGGGHQGHPLVHHHALCVHAARPGASLYGVRRTRPRIFSCVCRANANVEARSQPPCRRPVRCRGADARPSFATAAAPSGCSTPAPAPRCSPAPCSASSSAPSSSRRRSIPAPRIT